jgi:hypothetical protein
MIQEEELRSLGVSEEPADLLDKMEATMEVYKDYIETNGAY